MWFTIDMADGTESLWFVWPMFGTGVAVAIIAVGLLGIGGLFGTDWERRQVDRYLVRHRDPDAHDWAGGRELRVPGTRSIRRQRPRVPVLAGPAQHNTIC